MDQHVSFEVAVIAESKGFKDTTLSFYVLENKYLANDNIGKLSSYDTCSRHPVMWDYSEVVAAPTQAHLHRWFRDEHELDINILSHPSSKKYYFFNIERYKDANFVVEEFNCINKHKRITFETYEKALEEALFVALDLI
jgi:hypothetical protein